jgi:uncharacterized RDD family membrane protein YckC
VESPPPVPPELSNWLPWSHRNQIRASDADREQVVSELTEHHVMGRLSSEELSDRTQLAYGSKTTGELNSLLADLPGRPRGSMAVWEGVWSLRAARPLPGMGYVGFWPRAAALWADLILIGAIGYGTQALTGDGHLVLLEYALSLPYFVLLWATTGRTFGLWLVGARVVRQEDGGRLGLRRSLVRLVGYLFDSATCFVGFAWAGIDRRKQGWHDKMAGSYVVRKLT